METLKQKVERLLDANFNRAREGLRVIEDTARFILDSPEMTAKAKRMRSRLSEIQTKASVPLSSRDTENDSGTSMHSKTERKRDSLQQIVRANAKRTQESLRVLEEFLKLNQPGLAQEIKQLRYNSYILEEEIIEALEKWTRN